MIHKSLYIVSSIKPTPTSPASHRSYPHHEQRITSQRPSSPTSSPALPLPSLPHSPPAPPHPHQRQAHFPLPPLDLGALDVDVPPSQPQHNPPPSPSPVPNRNSPSSRTPRDHLYRVRPDTSDAPAGSHHPSYQREELATTKQSAASSAGESHSTERWRARNGWDWFVVGFDFREGEGWKARERATVLGAEGRWWGGGRCGRR